MAVDNCPYTFDDIVQIHIPRLLGELDAKRNQRIGSEAFRRTGNGYKRTLRELGHHGDFPGCYVFFEGEIPMYVGISKNVITRIWNHYNAVNHYGSNLIYKIASERNIIQNHKSEFTGEDYRAEFNIALACAHEWTVIFQEVPDHISLYLFEVCAAMHFDTMRFNSFKTH